jgi:hypothetical protein
MVTVTRWRTIAPESKHKCLLSQASAGIPIFGVYARRMYYTIYVRGMTVFLSISSLLVWFGGTSTSVISMTVVIARKTRNCEG